jgi:hypothetical protein
MNSMRVKRSLRKRSIELQTKIRFQKKLKIPSQILTKTLKMKRLMPKKVKLSKENTNIMMKRNLQKMSTMEQIIMTKKSLILP